MHNLGKIDKDEHYICSKCKTKIFKQQGKKIGLIYFYENEWIFTNKQKQSRQ